MFSILPVVKKLPLISIQEFREIPSEKFFTMFSQFDFSLPEDLKPRMSNRNFINYFRLFCIYINEEMNKIPADFFYNFPSNHKLGQEYNESYWKQKTGIDTRLIKKGVELAEQRFLLSLKQDAAHYHNKKASIQERMAAEREQRSLNDCDSPSIEVRKSVSYDNVKNFMKNFIAANIFKQMKDGNEGLEVDIQKLISLFDEWRVKNKINIPPILESEKASLGDIGNPILTVIFEAIVIEMSQMKGSSGGRLTYGPFFELKQGLLFMRKYEMFVLLNSNGAGLAQRDNFKTRFVSFFMGKKR